MTILTLENSFFSRTINFLKRLNDLVVLRCYAMLLILSIVWNRVSRRRSNCSGSILNFLLFQLLSWLVLLLLRPRVFAYNIYKPSSEIFHGGIIINFQSNSEFHGQMEKLDTSKFKRVYISRESDMSCVLTKFRYIYLDKIC